MSSLFCDDTERSGIPEKRLPVQDGFKSTVIVQLEALKSTLIAAHDQKVSVLNEEVKRLRTELARIESDKAKTLYKLDEMEHCSLNSIEKNAPSSGLEPMLLPGSVMGGEDEISNSDGNSFRYIAGPEGDKVTGHGLAQPESAEMFASDRPAKIPSANAEFLARIMSSSENVETNNKHLHNGKKRGRESMSTRGMTLRLYNSRDSPHPNRRSKDVPPNPQHDWLQRFVFSQKFELMSSAVIVTNTVVIALQLQYTGFDSGYAIRAYDITEPGAEMWPGAETAFSICNYVFNAMFAVELLLRLGAQRIGSLMSGWIWFDVTVVTIGLIDVFAADALDFNPGMMRVIRLFRLVRLLKLFQSLSTFDSLFLLLKSLSASRLALFWSFLLLGIVQLVTGLFVCQLLQDYFHDDSVETEARRKVFKYFGTFSRSMLTMFEITLANWVPSCRAMVDNVSEMFILFYIVYRCMFCFACLKVIAAVFITETNRVLENDEELVTMKNTREKLMFKAKIASICGKLDTDDSGTLSWEELGKLKSDPHLTSALSTVGLASHDLDKLFWLIDEGDGEIPIFEFISKIGKLRGQSKSLDMLSTMKLAHRIDSKVQLLIDMLGVDQSNVCDEIGLTSVIS